MSTGGYCEETGMITVRGNLGLGAGGDEENGL